MIHKATAVLVAFAFVACCDCRTNQAGLPHMTGATASPQQVVIENEANASPADASLTREFLEVLPADCDQSRAFAAQDGTVRIRVQCSGQNYSKSGIIQIKNGVVREID